MDAGHRIRTYSLAMSRATPIVAFLAFVIGLVVPMAGGIPTVSGAPRIIWYPMGYSKLGVGKHRVIRTEAELAAAWQVDREWRGDLPTVRPQVDFSKDAVVLAYMGSIALGTYSFRHMSVWIAGDTLHGRSVAQRNPGVVGGLTQEAHHCLVVVPKRVVHVETRCVQVEACGAFLGWAWTAGNIISGNLFPQLKDQP
jgi:hypothetical protein